MRSTALLLTGLLALAACTNGAADPAPASSSDEISNDTVLLDCNVFLSGGGPDQQVTVVQRGEELFLRELTNHGAWIERPLSAEEWETKDLALRREEFDGPDAVNRLYLESGDWMNESKSPGWHAMGFADCSRR